MKDTRRSLTVVLLSKDKADTLKSIFNTVVNI